MKCETCKECEAVGVASVPMVPYSAPYCGECLAANAHPLWVLLANTSINGGLEHCNPEWREMVHDTLHHLNKTLEWFNEEVRKSIAEEENL